MKPTSNDTSSATETENATDSPGDETVGQTAEITVDDRTTNGTVITVRSAVFPDDGFVVVYDTTMAAPLGTEFLASGAHENVSVSLNQLLTEDQPLVVFAFQDTNENQRYDPETDEVSLTEDQPVLDVAGTNVTSASNSLAVEH